MSEYLLEGRNLCQTYQTNDRKALQACLDVNFTLKAGETLGIVGESGCGKSTLLKMMTQLEAPTSGTLLYQGTDITHETGRILREHRRRIQMVFQDPATAFSPRMKVKDALCEPLLNYEKCSKAEQREKVAQLLELVELPADYANRHCHAMSGGQRQRLGVARALALEPAILVCDEATSSLDVSIQAKIMELIARIQRERGLSMVFVCHDVALVQSISHRIMVMYLGTVVEVMPSHLLSTQGKHPYTQKLISAMFSLHMAKGQTLSVLEGDVPSPLNRPTGCPFHTRCPHATDRCRQEVPTLKTVGDGHQVACHLWDS